MPSMLSGKDGAALVTALMLTVLSLVVAMTLLYTVTSGVRIAASQKRYRSALAAAHGGVELVTQEIIPRLLRLDPQSESRLVSDFALIQLTLPAYGCLQQKLGSPTASWSAACAAQALSDPANLPDFSFNLNADHSAAPGYRVTMKIVDTVLGNTDSAGFDLLEPGSSVTGKEEIIHPQHVPDMFNISVQGVGGGPQERARLSVLYAY
jgi:hypothetical protein